MADSQAEQERPLAQLDPWKYDDRTIPEQVPLELLGTFAAFLRNGNAEEKLQGALMIRKMLTVEDAIPIDEVIAEGCVELFVAHLLDDKSPELQFQSAWALTNIISGNEEHTEYVLKTKNAVPNLIRLLDSPNENCKEQTAWALGSLAGEGPRGRDTCLDCGALQPLLNVVDATGLNLTTHQNTAWAVSNLCRGKPLPKLEQVAAALPVFADLLGHRDDEMACTGAWGLAYLSEGDSKTIRYILDTGCWEGMIELLSANSTRRLAPALEFVGNVARLGDAVQVNAMISCSTMTPVKALLTHPKPSIRKAACQALHHAMGTTTSRIHAVMETNAIPDLIRNTRDRDLTVVHAAVLALGTVTAHGSKPQLDNMLENGLVPCLCDALGNNYCGEVRTAALKATQLVLRECSSSVVVADSFEAFGGLDCLERLKRHHIVTFSSNAKFLVGVHFPPEASRAPLNGSGEQAMFGIIAEAALDAIVV